MLERQRAELALRQSGEQLRTVFDAIGDWISVVDSDLRIVMANEAYRQMTLEFGLASDPLGRTPHELFPFLPTKAIDEFRQVFETGQPLVTHETTRAGSLVLHTETRKVPILDDGVVVRVITIVRDVTDEERAEETVRVAETRRQAMLKAVPDLIFRLSGTGVILDYHAPHPEDVLGTPEIFMGQRMVDVLPAEVARTVAAGIEAFQRTGQPQSVRYLLELPVGLRHFEARIVSGGDGEILMIVRNITELVQSEDRALQLRLEKERSAILAGFVQDVSHEFGNPLSVIKNNVYLIAHDTEPDRVRRRLDGIGGQVFHIERLVKGLLTMTQLDHMPQMTCETLDLNALVQTVLDGLASSVRAKNHQITLSLEAALPAVFVDQRLFSQVIGELVRNAVLFTPPGGQITLATRQQAGEVVIECRDSGIGIGAVDLPHLFERFFRVDKARGERGAGLGLPIAQKIVEMHGGRLEVTSAPGQGSTFQVFLPIRPA